MAGWRIWDAWDERLRRLQIAKRMGAGMSIKAISAELHILPGTVLRYRPEPAGGEAPPVPIVPMVPPCVVVEDPPPGTASVAAPVESAPAGRDDGAQSPAEGLPPGASDPHDEAIAAAWIAGEASHAIAARFGLSRSGVQRVVERCRRAGMALAPRRPGPAMQMDLRREAVALARQGLTCSAIGDRLGCGKAWAGRLLAAARAAGEVPPRANHARRAVRAAKQAEAVRLWNGGADRRAIAAGLDCSPDWVGELLREARKAGVALRADAPVADAKAGRLETVVRLTGEGYSLAEIAGMAGLTRSAVGGVIHRARAAGRTIEPKRRRAETPPTPAAQAAGRVAGRQAPPRETREQPARPAVNVTAPRPAVKVVAPRPAVKVVASRPGAAVREDDGPEIRLPPPVVIGAPGDASLVGRLEARIATHVAGVTGRPDPAPSILELGLTSCRMPAGYGSAAGARRMLFCGAPTLPDESWCRACRRLAWQPRPASAGGAQR